MSRGLLRFGSSFLMLAPLLGAAVATPGDAARAEEVMRRLRTALGGEAALDQMQSLTIEGTLRRSTETGDVVSGTIHLDLLRPSFFQKVRSEGVVASSIPMIRSWGFDGQASWSAFNGRVANDLEDSAGELERLFLLLTGQGATPNGLTLAYLGEATAPDGRAEVIEAKDVRGAASRLFVDPTTGLPLMLSYRGRLMASGMTFAIGDGTRFRTLKDKKASSADTTIDVRVGDYKLSGTLLFPGTLTFSVDQEVLEEWVVRYRPNAPLKPSQFRP